MNSESKMIKFLFDELEKKGIEYCILRNVEDILEGTCHDVDFAIDWNRINEFKDLLNYKITELGWQVFVMKDNDQGELLSIHLATKSGKVLLMHLDAFKSFNWKGIPLVSNQKLIDGRRKYKNVWVCSEAVEIALKLFSKYLHGGEVRDKYRIELMNTIPQVYEPVSSLIRGFLSEKTSNMILKAAEAGEWDLLHKNVDVVRNEIKERYFGKNIINMD